MPSVAGLALAERLRDALPGRGRARQHGRRQLQGAAEARGQERRVVALIVGDDEAARGVAAVKWLRTGAAQQEWPWDELPRRLAAALETDEASGTNDGR